MKKTGVTIFLLAITVSVSPRVGERILKNYRIVFYNVENFFDMVDDSATADEEFLPGGMRGWNSTKYRKKQANISKVIAAIGGWDAPPLIGLCEVESNKALTDLTRYSPLAALKYEFIHHESPDPRGIDTALLYQPELFRPVADEALKVSFPEHPHMTTRDILYVSGIVPSNDTLHVFVCHFPSRLGGEMESENKRMTVAARLKAKIDELYRIYHNPNIVVMGDFNDYPDNRSLTEVLAAKEPSGDISATELYNLMIPLQKAGKGTHKYQGESGVLDQIIVSGALLNPQSGFYTLPQDVRIFDADFLLEDDRNYLGKQPFRTYVGMRYNDGFSDHLPVYVDCWY
ncbi:MAG: endonuclease [Prevotellaceae bacterium]|jgi:predicted extracellular nuclease|nr:endonuclease [Prevotellaceae bacterium]